MGHPVNTPIGRLPDLKPVLKASLHRLGVDRWNTQAAGSTAPLSLNETDIYGPSANHTGDEPLIASLAEHDSSIAPRQPCVSPSMPAPGHDWFNRFTDWVAALVSLMKQPMEVFMTGQSRTIENLMKVTLNIQTVEPSADDRSSEPFVFIYGIGPSGITPFEKALHGKQVGDRVKLDVNAGTYCEAMGHLELPLRKSSGILAPVSLEVTVVDVVRAKDREVVKAMAAGGSCSDCGCGCGGH